MALDPTNTLLTITSAGSDLQSNRIEPDMYSVQNGYIKNISGVTFKNKAYITLTYSGTTNNRIYVFDYSMSNLKKSQSVSWVPFTGLSFAQLVVYDGAVYGASSTTSGFVYKLTGTGVYSDDGTAINSYYWTKEFSGFDEDTNYFKDFRYVNILIDNAGSYFMSLTYRTDSDAGDGNISAIDVTPGGSVWGTMVWARDVWGGGMNQKEYRAFLGQTRGKRLQLKFSNQNTVSQR